MGAKRALGALLAVAGLALATAGTLEIANQTRATDTYKQLAATGSASISADENEPDAIDWEGLLATNPSVVAWCRIEGTNISLPVCQATDESPEHWLTHDLWGNESPAGTPYVDHRATAESQHVLCYGHHLTGTGGMFSELYRCHEQDEFDRILTGDLLWSTPHGGTVRLHPLCAAVVDKDDAVTQRFDFESEAEFHLWLSKALANSTARSEEAYALSTMTPRAITLVTCASDLGGQPERTVITFVEPYPYGHGLNGGICVAGMERLAEGSLCL